MRVNHPTTQIEYVMEDGKTIVSSTDLQGNITYANQYFIEASGYSEQELLGAPQNILRHPDMPPEAFADMWRTIKSGTPWTGPVKNRRQNGDFYWVLANVTPIIEQGKPVGYLSVRTKPSRDQVEAADKLYREIRGGNPRRLRIVNGRVIQNGFYTRFREAMRMSLSRQVLLSTSVLSCSMLLLAVMLLSVEVASFATVRSYLATLALLVMAGMIGLGRSLYFKVALPLNQATEAARMMAGGDLTSNIKVQGENEMAQLLAALRQTNINLRSIIGDIRANFDQISIATVEIADGNMDLSGRTEAQASNLEETAASMEQLTSTVQQSASNVANANELADQASAVASEGGDIMAQVMTTMDTINASSSKILDIIGMIDGLAFQTNILALNAAVEAARAGEDGRGFAVVASEVRNLAQRSATAAKEIKELINASIAQVQSGAVLTRTASANMAQVIASVARVTRVMDEISNATREQSDGISQVNLAVIQIDDITQRNAALVEEAAAATGNLALQTRCVSQAIAVFKVSGGRATKKAIHRLAGQ